MTGDQRLPSPTNSEQGHRVRGTRRANDPQTILDEARIIIGVTAGLISLYGSTSSSYYCSPMIPLMLFMLECRMQGLVIDMLALQTEEDVD